MKPAKNRGMIAGRWWALLRGPASLPVLFSSRQQALSNMDSDEYLINVRVAPVSLLLLLRGQEVVQAAAKQKRQRLPVEQKRRRGRPSRRRG